MVVSKFGTGSFGSFSSTEKVFNITRPTV